MASLESRGTRDGALVDRFAGSDPGLNRLRFALSGTITIGLALAAEYAFVKAAGALQITPPSIAPPAVLGRVAAADHALLTMSMLIGAVVGLASALGVSDARARGQLASFLCIPLPLLAGMLGSLELARWRTPSLVAMVVVLAAGTYLRRFGPRGFIVGAVAFIGDLLGFLLHGKVGAGQIGWLAAEVGIALTAAIVVRVLLFRPDPASALTRTRRSFGARARRAVRLAFAVLEEPSARNRRRLHRQLARLNESALMFDACLAEPDATHSDAARLHEGLFDLELAIDRLARAAEHAANAALPDADWWVTGAHTLGYGPLRRLAESTRAAQAVLWLISVGERPTGAISQLLEACPHEQSTLKTLLDRWQAAETPPEVEPVPLGQGVIFPASHPAARRSRSPARG